MSSQGKTYRIFISAAEPSGDAHCADLIAAVRQRNPDIEFVGVGGSKMAAAGCEMLERTIDRATMAYEAFKHVAHYFRLVLRIAELFKKDRFDLVIVCDSPAFNFHVAKAAKKAGIKTLFYVAPQLWAWGQWRIKKLKKYCDKLACILPFEQGWFTQRGVNAVFVGNPMLDKLDMDLDRYRKRYCDFTPQKATIALMPGSRAAEINSLWQPMQQIAIRMRRKYPNLSFTAVAVDERGKEILKSMQVLGFRCKYTIDPVSEAARQADLSLVASGSATLQVAACGCPMVVMYQSSRVLWHLIGRWLLKTKHLSLVNILAGRTLVPEFMPYFSSIEPIVKTVEQLLQDSDRLIRTSDELIRLVMPLHAENASEKVAEMAIEMLAAK